MVVVGTHTSIAWGIEHAPGRSAEIGWTTMQIFAKSPRGWKIPQYDDEQFVQGKNDMESHGQSRAMVHANYLANLSKDPAETETEIASILHDFEVAHRLGATSVNVHVGKLKGFASRDEAMKNMVTNVEKILKDIRDAGYDDVQYLFENTAGQGSEIGSTFEELSYFWNTYLKDLPVKFTIDTAHCRWWGIDLSKRDEFIEQFAEQIGIEQIYGIHLNDAKVILGSNLDRHASLGRGFVGRPTLTKIIQRAEANERPLYIETPEPDLWPDEIAKVRKIAAGETDRIADFHKEHYKTQYLKKYESVAKGEGLF